MPKTYTLSTLQEMLSKDLGLSALLTNAFNGWLTNFNQNQTTSFGDISFKSFSSLPDAGPGIWSTRINEALSDTREATLKLPTPGTLGANRERILSSSNDYWRGGDRSERVNAGEGDDVLTLAGGNDYAQGGSGNDVILGERGNDTLIGGRGDDFIMGGAGRDKLYGWSGDDIIFGGSGNDGIFGNEGDDTIFGGDGRDYICGGSGHDILYGGAGADTFAFRGQAPNSVTVIKDFQVGFDKQKILAPLAGGQLRLDMIDTYEGGCVIEFEGGRKIFYENVWDERALFSSMSLFE